MSLLTQEDQAKVAQAVKDVESRTNAELVTVLCARSDEYRYIPVLWACLVALLIPSALYFFTLPIEWTVWGQLSVFIVLALALQLSIVRVRLIPKSVRYWRASNMARRQFLEQGLHRTDLQTGVLIFVSEDEHYVEILVDDGISSKIPDTEWQEIVQEFVDHVKSRNTLQGFLQCLSRVGDDLEVAVPKTPDNKNELDDRLILIGYD